MATYHIKDDGMPGRCTARSVASCPKSEDSTSGAAFHGSLEEASAESQRRFEEKLGAFVTTSRAEERKEPRAEELYLHPQGKVIRVSADGTVQAYKNGKQVSTSATAEKLRAGYGAWKPAEGEIPGVSEQETSRPQRRPKSEKYIAPAARAIPPESIDGPKGPAIREALDGVAEAERKLEDSLARVREIQGKLQGQTERDSETIAELGEARADWLLARKGLESARTDVENLGAGSYLPDAGDTVRVNSQAQKVLFRSLQGQITDGFWENSSDEESQMRWGGSEVVVDSGEIGRNFYVRKDNYQLNARQLVDIMGDEWLDRVRAETGDDSYSREQMMEDLKGLRSIFKTKR